ncbi:MAG: RNA methyltransferase, partial [Clostridia bacterium]|nr:RNA methyltransferase [Clostridia bacterium]
KTVTDTAELSKSKKARDASGVFTIEGIKLFDEAVLSGMEIKSVFFTEKALSIYGAKLEGLTNAEHYLVTDEVYEKLSDESAPQGILAIVKKPLSEDFTEASLKEGSFVLLEDIQNPLNIGAILRCCYSMGFEKVVFSEGCADVYSPKCARAAMGSLFKIKAYFSDDLSETARALSEHGCRVFCTSLGERSVKLGSFDFVSSDCFVIGNEGHGASDTLMNACSHSLFIPMNEGAESLNAATAAAIVMWEMKKDTLSGK